MDGNRVDSWISGGSGPHELEKLKPGSYVIVEEAAPDGYLCGRTGFVCAGGKTGSADRDDEGSCM